MQSTQLDLVDLLPRAWSGESPLANLATHTTTPVESGRLLRHVEGLDKRLHKRFVDAFDVDGQLSRQAVSFQGNKTRAAYRWYKYKEAFSAGLVERIIRREKLASGTVLDPFAGMGTTLFAASSMGLDAHGIEVLPVGQELINSRLQIEANFHTGLDERLTKWSHGQHWEHFPADHPLPELRITKDAYSPGTVEAVSKFLTALEYEAPELRPVLRLALLCVLESISYTRKDGQYLRWDYRSGRRQGRKRFDKGRITTFAAAISSKIAEIVGDLRTGGEPLFVPSASRRGAVQLFAGSSLKVLPVLPPSSYSAVITSPPYCNRYDYTRTYALELAMLGVGEDALRCLRQEMLTCTVENREKDLLELNPGWQLALDTVRQEELLQAILCYLESERKASQLNNTGIPRMVRGYFDEMACVIQELSRVLKPSAVVYMVNDNVRYAGASVSVDLILSSIAESLGFRVERISLLPNGKGNSSQQMGKHGRSVLRKCIYTWRKA